MEEEEGMQCSRHPPRGRRNPAGGICAECLQEKLGRLVAGGGAARPYSSLPSPPASSSIRPTVVESSSAGYGDDLCPSVPSSGEQTAGGRIKPAMIPFLFPRKKSKPAENSQISRNRKKTKRRSFWSLLQFHSSASSDEKGRTPEEESPESRSSVSSLGRRVARSRSVGCGSRSFSGDVIGRISSGFGDCALRRAESQREKLRIRTGEPAGGLEEGLTPRGRRNWAFRALASPIRAFRASSRLAAIASENNAIAAAIPPSNP